MKEIIASLNELDTVVNHLNKIVPSSAIIFLIGNLAAGKTTLTKKIAKAKGIEGEITSPTFSLQQCYAKNLFHYDLYRIENHEFMELGLFEEFDKEGWHILEWGDVSLKNFLLNAGYEVFTVKIEAFEEKRKYKIEKS
ncbi:MAG: TsaE protein, required for threonylcarbamoyladenosine t(6)A37 formation in tRNA [uncultured Sulfurovum sp.]|uniref:tRNA threonylcarbamoyladenosine biosynthesis protein TsaE n=1 Tax=uncultured Sulfurovum sp. TaxID=269237 RepID=A0A6S6SKI5_9BACT|nr:MAG: TsaE protein, required for threonylcarbamoyladenosine t(6)A37 formation in tRNA [uncultured Sulfurovum sp.]